MRYVLLSSLALLLGSFPSPGQTRPAPPKPGNAAWLDSVQQLPLPQQVAAVQQRAWRDTLLAPYQMPGCWLGVAAATRRAALSPTQPKPTKPQGFPLVYVVDGQIFYNHDAATIGQLQRRLRSQPIRQVTLLRDATATAIYGARAANGVVVLASAKARHR